MGRYLMRISCRPLFCIFSCLRSRAPPLIRNVLHGGECTLHERIIKYLGIPQENLDQVRPDIVVVTKKHEMTE
jgi:hypothetical protein